MKRKDDIAAFCLLILDFRLKGVYERSPVSVSTTLSQGRLEGVPDILEVTVKTATVLKSCKARGLSRRSQSRSLIKLPLLYSKAMTDPIFVIS